MFNPGKTANVQEHSMVFNIQCDPVCTECWCSSNVNVCVVRVCGGLLAHTCVCFHKRVGAGSCWVNNREEGESERTELGSVCLKRESRSVLPVRPRSEPRGGEGVGM